MNAPLSEPERVALDTTAAALASLARSTRVDRVELCVRPDGRVELVGVRGPMLVWKVRADTLVGSSDGLPSEMVRTFPFPEGA